MDKSKLTESDIITKFILPAIKDAGWDDMTQIRQEVKLRNGRVVRGQAAAMKVKSANYAITISINNPGGSVFDGIAIYNALSWTKSVQ
ncbi:ATP-dependent Clp protease proteolytic subunit [Endozoicomonas sp.]|uniref:ATP-dependent Clp protease proteolytic subunit n=1 Tax=Endozoicomonas sp. TaxID=1892382 RepID=UPI002886EC1E|nr:ATP-dependent Clp protease proteolytic subunit [Endozoicomonas sp.]